MATDAQTGPRLTITGTCSSCDHLRLDADVYRCAHPGASSVAEPMICSAHREPRPPAWCPEMSRARLALARSVVVEPNAVLADIVGPARAASVGRACAVGMDGPWLWGGCNRLDGKCRDSAARGAREESEER